MALSKREVYRKVDLGHLPRPLKQGNRSYFFNTDIEAYFDRLDHQRAS